MSFTGRDGDSTNASGVADTGPAAAGVSVLGVSPSGDVPEHSTGLKVQRWVSPDEAVWLLSSGQLRPDQVVLIAADLDEAGWSLGKLDVAGVGDAVTHVLLSRSSVMQSVRTLFQLQKSIDNIPAPIFSKDAKGVYGACNEAFEKFVGIPRERIIGRTVHEMWDPELAAVYAAADKALFDAGGHQVYDAKLQYADGSIHDVTFYKGVFADEYGVTQGMSGAVLDITERRALEAQLQELADTDPLTGVANRALFSRRLDSAAAQTDVAHRPTVVLIDLDDFKTVNDTLGHGVGDELLVAISKVLRHCARSTDVVARLGGDEFAVLLENVAEADVEALVERVLHGLVPPLIAAGRALVVRASIGVARGGPSDAGVDMLRNADIALYVAKGRGKDRCVYYRPGMQARILHEATLLDGLREALARNQISVDFQPIVRLGASRRGETGVLGMEALARWQDADLGLVPPAEFIPIAESRGLIAVLGRWVLRAACHEANRWPGAARGSAAMAMHVNVSSYQLREPGFVTGVSSILAETGLDPARLILEITETAVADDMVADALGAVRALGVRVAVDDFGTGQSSLSVLATCPVDIIKVDKSFVDRVSGSRREAAIPIAIVQLAENLGIRAIAEGVETAEQAQRLHQLGYREAQGFHFARPLPPAGIDAYFEARARTTAAGTREGDR